jgi:hypothetical protein
MTSDGKLTKDELKNLTVGVKRDTDAIRLRGHGEIEGQTIEAEVEAGRVNGREHDWLDVALGALIEAIESVADDFLGDAGDEPEPQAK